MNIYNVRAVRKELDGCIRSASWQKFRRTFQTVSRNAATCQAVVLHKPRTKGSDVHGSLLHAVIYKSNSRPPPGVDIIEALSSAAPQVLHVQDSRGRTPLHVAVDRCAPLVMIECLLRADETNETFTMMDRSGNTPIMTAVKDCSDDVVELLLRHDQDGRSLLVKSRKRGRTPLYFVASNELRFVGSRDYELPFSVGAMLLRTHAALKISQGQNTGPKSSMPYLVRPTCGNDDQPNPLGDNWLKTCDNITLDCAKLLRAAISCAHLLGKFSAKVIEILLKSAEANNETTKILGMSDDDGNTMLHLLCMAEEKLDTKCFCLGSSDEIGLLQYLMKRYSNALELANASGNLPLHLGIIYEKGWKFVEKLLEGNPESIKVCNKLGELPFHLAIKHGLCDGVEDVAGALWKRHPGALTVVDASTRLYPFQLAACYEKKLTPGTCGSPQKEQALVRIEEKVIHSHGRKNKAEDHGNRGQAENHSHAKGGSSVNEIYLYLRECPDVLQHFLPMWGMWGSDQDVVIC